MRYWCIRAAFLLLCTLQTDSFIPVPRTKAIEHGATRVRTIHSPVTSPIKHPRNSFRCAFLSCSSSPASTPSSPRSKLRTNVLSLSLVFATFIIHVTHLSRLSLPPLKVLGGARLSLDDIIGSLTLTSLLTMRPSSSPKSIQPRERHKIPTVILALATAYFSSGYLTSMVSSLLGFLSSVGIPITAAMNDSLTVLLGHLAWVLAGGMILSRNHRIFDAGEGWGWGVKSKRRGLMIAATYMSSVFAFNLADHMQSLVVPPAPFSTEGVIERLLVPSGRASSLVGSLAPCLSAPLWEETLYRLYLPPALLSLGLPPLASVLASALAFSAHHMSLTALVPLFALGLVWNWVYYVTGDIWIGVAVHSMWNSRVFVATWLGL